MNNVVPSGGGLDVAQDYGDRVTGSPMNVPGGQFTYGNEGEGFTPNVVVDYSTGNATPPSTWIGDYGDLTNVVFGNQNSLSLMVQLTADPGFLVLLYHFDLAGWPTSDYTIDSVQVLSGVATLFSQSNVLVEGDGSGPGHTAFDFPTPLSASQLLIAIDYGNLAGNQQDNIGIDNIRFGQDPPPDLVTAIPEPSTVIVVGFGLLALAAWRREKLL